jgi:hypothetical protein
MSFEESVDGHEELYTSCLGLTGDLRQTLCLPNDATFKDINDAVKEIKELANEHILKNFTLSREGLIRRSSLDELSYSLTILRLISNPDKLSIALRLQIFVLVLNEAYKSTNEYDRDYMTLEDRPVSRSERARQSLEIIEKDWENLKEVQLRSEVIDAKVALSLTDEPFDPKPFLAGVIRMMQKSDSVDLKEFSRRMESYIMGYAQI